MKKISNNSKFIWSKPKSSFGWLMWCYRLGVRYRQNAWAADRTNRSNRLRSQLIFKSLSDCWLFSWAPETSQHLISDQIFHFDVIQSWLTIGGDLKPPLCVIASHRHPIWSAIWVFPTNWKQRYLYIYISICLIKYIACDLRLSFVCKCLLE